MQCTYSSFFDFRLRLNASLDETLLNFDSLESDESEGDEEQNEEEKETIDDILTIPKRSFGKRFDSTLCMILPNSYCIPPSSEKNPS